MKYAVIFLLLTVPSAVFCQQVFTGKVKSFGKEEILASVSVYNLSQRVYVLTDVNGSFTISVRDRDTIIISSVGYLPDTMLIDLSLINVNRNGSVLLIENVESLPAMNFQIKSKYERDSIKRTQEYAWLYPHHPRKLVGNESVSNGVGVSISPITHFSSIERQKRKLRKKLKLAEKEYYIDYRFSPSLVFKLTGLKGNELAYFLSRYRPSYDFCRSATDDIMLFYVNDKIIAYKREKKSLPGETKKLLIDTHGQ